jgi:putative FmdB family regulatory protein
LRTGKIKANSNDFASDRNKTPIKTLHVEKLCYQEAFTRRLNMPIYEYHCPRCNADFELMRSFSQSNETALCPRCGTASEKLASVCATNADYRIRFPVKEAFRRADEEKKTSTP